MGDSFGMFYIYLLHYWTSLHPSLSSFLTFFVSIPPFLFFLLPWYQWTKGTASLLFWFEGAGASLWVSSAGGGVLPAGRLRLAGWPRGPHADQGGHGDHTLLWTQTVLSSLGRSNGVAAAFENFFKSNLMFNFKTLIHLILMFYILRLCCVLIRVCPVFLL